MRTCRRQRQEQDMIPFLKHRMLNLDQTSPDSQIFPVSFSSFETMDRWEILCLLYKETAKPLRAHFNFCRTAF